MKPVSRPSESAIANSWDRVWTSHSYRFPRLRTERARIKVAAAVELGLHFEESDRALDLACGSGDNLLAACEGAHHLAHLVAMDISPVALSLARANFTRAHVDVQLVRGEWSRLPLRSRSFDKVLAFMAPVPEVIVEICRVLKPGGKLFMIAPSRDSITSALYRIREMVSTEPFGDGRNYSAPDLRLMLGEHLVVEKWRVIHSGSDRPISTALDRIIATFAPRWGRYTAVRCALRSRTP